ncbi:MAG: ferredoxin-type protein NapF, partial [Betaproteobacteria bacterium PRO3]|nr:ferredoxin-type protein NapF [Betaproteobacteria bacterium PRO3]
MGARRQERTTPGQADTGVPASLVRRAVLGDDTVQGTLRPPWARDPDAFDRACTGCAKCVDACPTHVLTLASNLARVDYADGECTFCGACADVCPEPAFDLAARAASARPWTAVARIDATCLARLGVECRSCGDACEAQAIRFRV